MKNHLERLFFSPLIDNSLADLGALFRFGCFGAEALPRSLRHRPLLLQLLQVSISSSAVSKTPALRFVGRGGVACVRSVCLRSDGSGFWQGD